MGNRLKAWIIMRNLDRSCGSTLLVSRLRAIAVLLPASAALMLSSIATRADDWPAYRGPAGDGLSRDNVATGGFTSAAPRRLWRADTASGFSSFAVSEGKAFTIVARDHNGVTSETCIALDVDKGQELWAAPTGTAKYEHGGDSGADGNQGGDGPRSTPAVRNGRVFVYSSTLVLHCLDAATGKPLWKKDIIADFAGANIKWQSAMSPVLDGELVFVAGGGSGQSLLAFDQKTGALAWKSGDEKLTHATPTVATLQGVRQVIFFMQSGLVSVDAQNGKELWRYAFPYKTSTSLSPVVGGDIVFCSAGYDVGSGACQISKNGNDFKAKEIWRIHGNKDLVAQWSTPVYKDGYLYGMFSAKKFASGPMKCVDIKTGQVKWEQPGFGVGNLILANNALIALADDGQVALVEANPSVYKETARFKAVAGKCWSTPALSNGRLYVRSTKEGACFDLASRSTARNGSAPRLP
jgi:outer membrane protein assembly factor BamB